MHIRRRDSDKRNQNRVDLDDIWAAFEALDCNEALPAIYCEAHDLLLLPPPARGPPGIGLLPATTACDLNDLKVKMEEMSAKVEGLQSKLTEVNDKLSSGAAISTCQRGQVAGVTRIPGPVTNVVARNSEAADQERRRYLIVFGLEEKDSTLETKSDVDKLFHHLVGRDVQVKDAIRLGRRGARKENSLVSARPQPLLLKLMCPWDCRIVLASKHKLRGYAGGHVYIHPDRSLEE